MDRYHHNHNSPRPPPPPPPPLPPSASFSRRVQSVFVRSASSFYRHHHTSANTNTSGFSSHILPSIAATKSVESLTCASLSDGKRNLDAVIQHVIDGDISMFELSSALFPSDDDGTDGDDIHVESESDTCLCNLALLIKSGYVGIGDINVLKVRARAIFEASNINNNNIPCKCGKLVAVQNTIESVLNTGRSHARDKFLEAFLCSLLKTSQLSSTIATNSLALVEPVVQSVLKILSGREINHLLSKWAHVVVFQKNASKSISTHPSSDNINDNNDGDDDADQVREYWTTELRDLAIGQNSALHLMNKTTEEKALLVLFSAMNEQLVISLVSQVLTTICNTNYGANSGNSLSEIEFARFCTLAKYAGTLRNDDDEENSKDANNTAKILETSLMSALCSFQATASGQNQAMVITLARFFFIGKDHTVSERYVRYEKWFLNALKSASKPCVKILLEILADLLPLDPLPYLKAQTRCFRRVRTWMQLSQDYNILARTRIKDLEPNNPADSNDKAAQKIMQSMEDLCKYVAQFYRNRNGASGDKESIPKSLGRFMNFHRYSFRENLLPLLTAAEVNPPQNIIDREFALGGIDLFDEQRIELIKILAYKRMDKAIRKDEADKCIPKIEENIKKRKEALLNQPAEGRTRLKTPQNINADSDIAVIFQELCNAAKDMENAGNGQKKENDIDTAVDVVDVDAPVPPPKITITNNMSHEAPERWKKADALLEAKLLEIEDVPQGAADLLQLITDQVQISAAETAESPELIANGHSKYPTYSTYFESDRNQYRLLWDSCRAWMTPLVMKILSRKKLMGIWQNLKFIAIANICFLSSNEGSVCATRIFAIAVLVFATVKCSDENVTLGLPFLHKGENQYNTELLHIVDAIQNHLPVDNYRNVANSLTFATHYLMLVLSNCANPAVISVNGNGNKFLAPTKGPDGTYFWNTQEGNQRQAQRQSEILPRQLINLVRWTCSQGWRLKYNRDMKFINKDFAAFEVIKLIRRSLGIIERLRVLKLDEFCLGDWIPLEIKAGWGRYEKIPQLLAKFAGNKPLSLVVREIATAIVKTHAGETGDGRGFVPAYILYGLSNYAKALRYSPQSSKESQAHSMSFARCINDAFRSDAQVHPEVGYTLVELAVALPPAPFYFLYDTVGDIFMHIHVSLSPRFWPFSISHLDFLLDAMIAADSTLSQTKGREIQSTPAFVASIAFHSAITGGKKEECYLRNQMRRLRSPQWNAFRKDVEKFSSILRKLFTRGADGQDNDGALGTQALATQFSTQGSWRMGNEKDSADARLAVQYHPEIVGLALLQYVKEGRKRKQGDNAADIRANVEWLVGAVGELLAADVLDVAIEIAAQIPFVRPEEDESLLWSNTALAEFIPCRIQLCKSAQVPYWMNGNGMVCDRRRIPGCVFNVRRLVGMVEECKYDNNNNSYASPMKKIRHGECGTKIHVLWHARIGGAFAKMGDSVLEEALQMKSNKYNNNNSCEEGVLPMLARVLEDLHRADLDAVMGSLWNLKNNAYIGEDLVKRILTNQASGVRVTLERISRLHINMVMDTPVHVHADVINKVRNTAPSIAAMLASTRNRNRN